MSIINTPQINTVEKVKNNIVSNNKVAYIGLKDSVINGFNNVWNNKDFTPQEILNAFGADAKALFNLSWVAQQLLKSLDDTWVYLIPEYEVTFDEEGNATVGDKKEE
jgi:hypothetical protein